MRDSSDEQEEVKPLLGQLFTTVSGGIVLLNAFIFLLIARDSYNQSSSISAALFSPSTNDILRYGAKESVLLVSGEWWRLFCPIFIHIGLIHFLFNNFFLLIVGPQIEKMFGWKRYLAGYLLCGVMGNIFSALFSVGVSAGSSTSLFGLLGIGFVVERIYARRLEKSGIEFRRGFFTGLVVANVVIGLLLPFVDNFAHLGGFVGGVIFCFATLYSEKNHLLERSQSKSRLYYSLLAVLLVGLSFMTLSEESLRWRIGILNSYGSDIDKFKNYSALLRLDPDDNQARFHVARIMLLESAGDENQALMDLKTVAQDDEHSEKLLELAIELENRGLSQRSWQVKRLYEIFKKQRERG